MERTYCDECDREIDGVKLVNMVYKDIPFSTRKDAATKDWAEKEFELSVRRKKDRRDICQYCLLKKIQAWIKRREKKKNK